MKFLKPESGRFFNLFFLIKCGQVDYRGNVTLLTQAIYLSKCRVTKISSSMTKLNLLSVYIHVRSILLSTHGTHRHANLNLPHGLMKFLG